MPRKKRSERKTGEAAVAVMPAPVRPEAEVAERIMAAICPLCGRSIPTKRAIKIGYVTVDRIDYFDSINCTDSLWIIIVAGSARGNWGARGF